MKGDLLVDTSGEDSIIMAGTAIDVCERGLVVAAAMSDDLVAGVGVRATAPVDVHLHAIRGREERPGTATAYAVNVSLAGTRYEREYGPGLHAAAVAVLRGTTVAVMQTGFRPLMRTALGVRNLLPAPAAGGGGEAAPPAAPAAGPPAGGASGTGTFAGTGADAARGAGRTASEGAQGEPSETVARVMDLAGGIEEADDARAAERSRSRAQTLDTLARASETGATSDELAQALGPRRITQAEGGPLEGLRLRMEVNTFYESAPASALPDASRADEFAPAGGPRKLGESPGNPLADRLRMSMDANALYEPTPAGGLSDAAQADGGTLSDRLLLSMNENPLYEKAPVGGAAGGTDGPLSERLLLSMNENPLYEKAPTGGAAGGAGAAADAAGAGAPVQQVTLVRDGRGIVVVDADLYDWIRQGGIDYEVLDVSTGSRLDVGDFEWEIPGYEIGADGELRLAGLEGDHTYATVGPSGTGDADLSAGAYERVDFGADGSSDYARLTRPDRPESPRPGVPEASPAPQTGSDYARLDRPGHQPPPGAPGGGTTNGSAPCRGPTPGTGPTGPRSRPPGTATRGSGRGGAKRWRRAPTRAPARAPARVPALPPTRSRWCATRAGSSPSTPTSTRPSSRARSSSRSST